MIRIAKVLNGLAPDPVYQLAGARDLLNLGRTHDSGHC
jgi:hypothetical protein